MSATPDNLEQAAAELQRILDRRPWAYEEQDDLHRADQIGYARGVADGQRLRGEAQAHKWLAELAHDMEAMALCNAAAKGPHWQRAILEQARGAD